MKSRKVIQMINKGHDNSRMPADTSYLPHVPPNDTVHRVVESGLARTADPGELAGASADVEESLRAGRPAVRETVEVAADTLATTDMPPPPTEPPTAPSEASGPEEPEWRRQLAAEGATGPIEHLFSEGHSTAVNLDHPRQDLVDKVVAQTEHGIPAEAWHEGLQRDDTPNKYYTDAVPGQTPDLFIKVKPGMSQLEYQRRQTEIDDSDATPQAKSMELALLEAQSDARHELTQAATITQIVEGEAAQRIAHENDFAGMRYVAPVAVVTLEPQTDEQAMVEAAGDQAVAYPYVSGRKVEYPSEESAEIPPEVARMDAVHSAMLLEFYKKGIVAHDMSGSSFIIDEDNYLNLIDAEQFHPTPEPPRL
jgi:hypothetical protein